MDKKQLSRQMNAEQFAAFDTQLYLDTHPHDKVALQMYNNYRNSCDEYKKQYESSYGPLTADDGAMGGKWKWTDDPWPWEKEAN